MGTIMPEGEAIRQAVKWISCELQEDEKKNPISLIPQACTRFNLSPKEEEYLLTFYRENEDIKDGSCS